MQTERLKKFLEAEKVHVNWSDSLSKSNPWRIHHVTINERFNCLVLDMDSRGYQVFPADGWPGAETVEQEIARLGSESPSPA